MEWLMQIGKEYGLFVMLVAWVLWMNKLREDKYIQREDKYLAVIHTLSEEVKDRLTKIESMFRRKP